MRIAMEMSMPATVKKKGKFYISCCPLMDVCSQGETKKKALYNLSDALSLFFVSCFERGTLDEVLKQRGFVAAKRPTLHKHALEKPFADRFESVTVPIPFLIKHKKESNPCLV